MAGMYMQDRFNSFYNHYNCGDSKLLLRLLDTAPQVIRGIACSVNFCQCGQVMLQINTDYTNAELKASMSLSMDVTRELENPLPLSPSDICHKHFKDRPVTHISLQATTKF